MPAPKPKTAHSPRQHSPSDRSTIRHKATVLTGKVSQLHYDDVVERRFEKSHSFIEDAAGNGD